MYWGLAHLCATHAELIARISLTFGGSKVFSFKTESEKPGRLLFSRRERGTTAKYPFP